MFNILKSLLFRLKKSKMFWIMLAVVAFLPLLSLLLYKLVLQLADVLVDMPLDLELEMVTSISMTEWVLPSSTVTFLTLLCTSIFLCKEFSDGTIRNTLLVLSNLCTKNSAKNTNSTGLCRNPKSCERWSDANFER